MTVGGTLSVGGATMIHSGSTLTLGTSTFTSAGIEMTGGTIGTSTAPGEDGALFLADVEQLSGYGDISLLVHLSAAARPRPLGPGAGTNPVFFGVLWARSVVDWEAGIQVFFYWR